jgi:hypothetical protein
MIYFLLLLFSSSALAKPPTLPPTGNFVYIEQVGNNNQIYVSQQDSERKQAAVINNGDLNEFSILQQGMGNHTALIATTNNSQNSSNNLNIINIIQQGSGNHAASVLFQDPVSNNNNTANITQKGNAGADKQFTLQITGSNTSTTVIQDNLTTPDSASMSIQCLTPPCTGYSYIKH